MYFQSYGGREFGIKVLRWLNPLAFFSGAHLATLYTPHTPIALSTIEKTCYLCFILEIACDPLLSNTELPHDPSSMGSI